MAEQMERSALVKAVNALLRRVNSLEESFSAFAKLGLHQYSDQKGKHKDKSNTFIATS